ncbi:hypothetical protein IQ250_15370 [Pseudanabaenaceae cyanobacterium LEGE 13415]|nr:hypothetical protein [Pseudanabaenaceae cyanobacterium LEGE 13415]
MNHLYTDILDSLRQLSQTQNDELGFKQYLRSLQPSVKRLRKAYADRQIVVDYSSSEIQAAYLIAYYPHYAEMTFKSLDYFNFAEAIHQNHLNICLFGSGSCPEVIGILSYLNKTEIQSVTIETFDIAAETWKLSRDITIDQLSPRIWSRKFLSNHHTLDFCKESSFYSIQNVIAKSHLFIFQNCLNELFNAREIVKDNLKFLLETMPEASTLIIADQGEYGEVTQAMQSLENIATRLNTENEIYSIGRSEKTKAYFSTSLSLPAIISTCLLTGANLLKPRRNVKASYLKISRLMTSPLAVSVDRQFITQLEAELHQLKQTEQTHFASMQASIEQIQAQIDQVSISAENLVDFAEKIREQHAILSNQFKQLKADATHQQNALVERSITVPISQLQADLQQLRVTLNHTASSEQISQLEQAIETIGQRLNQIELDRNSILLKDQFDQWNLSLQRHAEIDRENLIKRLKQNRQITIVLTLISVLSFVIATIALFR